MARAIWAGTAAGVLFSALGGGSASAAPPAAVGEDAVLEKFFRDYLEEEFRRHPVDATRSGDHRFDDRMDDLSPAARAADLVRAKAVLADLPAKVAFAKLSRAGQIDFEILRHSLVRSIWSAEEARPYETDPRVWNEYISDVVFNMLTQTTVAKEVNLRNAAARIRAVPAVVAAAKASIKNPALSVLETAIRQNQGSIAFYETDLFEIAGVKPGTEPLASAAKEAVVVLKEYQTWLEGTLRPAAKGEWRLGRERYVRKLELELDAGLSADQVLADAESEFARVRNDMYVVARQLWAKTHPGLALPVDDADGRRETVRKVLEVVSREHGKPEDLVADAAASVEKIKAFITAKDILRLPAPDRCKIIEMPEFQRGNSVAYLNPAPPLDPTSDSIYAVSPPPKDWDGNRVRSFLQEYNRHMLQILTIHEAYPGHYVQLEYSNRHPSLLRKMLSSGVFAEGWAVYTEQMMLDQGYAEGDLSLRMNQLKFYLRCVANAILDHKLHAAGMTDEQAMELMVGQAFQSDGEARLKLIRAKQTSCQLSTYFVGRMAFYKLRQSVQREQGEAFSIGRYHEAVLSHGTLPVKYLPELVRERLKAAR